MADGSTALTSAMPTTDDLGVWIATPEHVDDLMQVAFMACEENGFLNYSPQKLLQQVWAALTLDHGLIGVIGKPGEQIEGVVLLRIGPMWYSDDLAVEEKVIFVHPQYRQAKGGRAKRLCEFSKRVADYLGLPLVIGVLSSHRSAAKLRMYERMLGPPVGAFFLYGAETGHAQRAET